MIVNGIERKIEKPVSIANLLALENIDPDKVVVEVGGTIIGKEVFDSHLLNHKDNIEIIAFVGGG